jgi:hypothetical protein
MLTLIKHHRLNTARPRNKLNQHQEPFTLKTFYLSNTNKRSHEAVEAYLKLGVISGSHGGEYKDDSLLLQRD